MDFFRGLFIGPPPAPSANRPEVDHLLEELIQIGKTDDYLSERPGSPFNMQCRHSRARQIGKRLFDIGGLELMEYTVKVVRKKVGKPQGEHLAYAWVEIGDWKV